MAREVLCKLLQRKTYDILSRKHTFLMAIFALVLLLISVLHFGEILLEWSKEKYAIVFSPYSKNILSRSYQNMLCQYVPIDVVYTWVNGSDPNFLKGLNEAKIEYGFSNNNCTFTNCVKSHMVLMRPQVPQFLSLSDLEEADSAFEHISKISVITSPLEGEGNITLLRFSDVFYASNVVEKKQLRIGGINYTFSSAHLTDSWGSKNTILMNDIFLLSQVPFGFTDLEIIDRFQSNIKSSISKVFIYEDKSLAVLTLNESSILSSVMKLEHISFGNKIVFILPAYLIIELPSDHEDISASRFTDNDELRYSLRSLEKNAPWVQHIYIISNGQIPHWLNLDNPWITIITHEDIFPNKTHLPTFSSPAIECHLHRIPNLSEKFLYLNDDVMFGKPVWPEDFYTHSKGQKVYLSWPVPNCAEGCPPSWIQDGYCDKPCNNSQCQWDGGDCSADNPILYQGSAVHRGTIANFLQFQNSVNNYCNDECADNWLADKYCDKACNIRECGFDAGDCGLDNFRTLPQLILYESVSHYWLPEGENVGFFNLTDFLASNHSINEGFYEENTVIRTLAISLKYSVIGIVLYANHNSTNITFILKGEYNSLPFEKEFSLHVNTRQSLKTDEKGHYSDTNVGEDVFTFEDFSPKLRFPKVNSQGNALQSLVSVQIINNSKFHAPVNLSKELEYLKDMLHKGIITEKGYLKKKSLIIESYLKQHNITYEALPFSMKSDDIEDKILHNENNFTSTPDLKGAKSSNSPKKMLRNIFPSSDSKTLSSKIMNLKSYQLKKDSSPQTPLASYFRQLANFTTKKHFHMKATYETSRISQRQLLDTFGDSLRHVNKLYNEAFGYEARKVPSHIAHFVDKNVMSRLTEKFSNAFEVTSSHKIRSSNDMQFAFSYYYYLMSEIENIGIEEIFDIFDIDKSGTWSDREIRTLLTQLHDLPLDFSSVAEFENNVNNCSLTTPASQISTPHYERYYDSNLPVVTKLLISSCPAISKTLLQHFGQRKKNGFEIVGEDEVAFKMIHNNLSQVLGQIDDLRKNPKKFVCLNDNMDHSSQEGIVIRAVIQDFYESLFPKRSQFELPPEYRNRFLYVSELKEWRKTRDVIRAITYISLAILVTFASLSFWKLEVIKSTFLKHSLRTFRAEKV